MKLTDEDTKILAELNRRAYAIIAQLQANTHDDADYREWQKDYDAFSSRLKVHRAWVPDSVSYRLQDTRKWLKEHYIDDEAEKKANDLLTRFERRFPDSEFDKLTIEEKRNYNTEAKKMFDELNLYSIPLPPIW